MDKSGIGAKTWVTCHRRRRYEGEVKISGAVKEFIDGKFTREFPNTVTTAFKNKSAQGAATGTFLAVDGGRMNYSGGDSGECATTKIAGGTGAEDYVTFEFEWTNSTGLTKTITSIDLGYDLEGGGEVIYFQQTGLSVAVTSLEKIKYQWTITIAYSSGGVTDYYRYYLARMIYTGLFDVPELIVFFDTGEQSHPETASLEEGGTGAEAYHQWNADYTAPDSRTIDIIYMLHTSDENLTEDDIADVAMVLNDTLEAHVRITHS